MTTGGNLDGDFYLPLSPTPERENKATNEAVEDLFLNVNTLLGGESLRVEMTDRDFRTCLKRAIDRYRTMSERSVYEAHGFLRMKPNVQTYVLHEAIDNVAQIYRRRALFGFGGGFDYFAQVSANLTYPGTGPGGYLGLATYDLSMQYEETLARLFARDVKFNFKPHDHTITFYSTQFGADEIVILRCYVLKTISELLADHWSNDWLTSYTLALAKGILGRKRSKFKTKPGAQGAMQLDGEDLLNESKEEIKQLEQDLTDMKDNSTPAYPIMG